MTFEDWWAENGIRKPSLITNTYQSWCRASWNACQRSAFAIIDNAWKDAGGGIALGEVREKIQQLFAGKGEDRP